MHAKDFDSALVKRNRALMQLIEDANKFLHDDPPGVIGPPVTRNNYFDSLGELSTSRGHAARDPPKYVAPSALPEAVLTPPKRNASDQPQQKLPPPAPPKPAKPSAAQRALDAYLQPIGPRPPSLPPLRHPDVTQPRRSTEGESAVNPPPPRPHTLLIHNSPGSTDSSPRTSSLNLLDVSPHASSNSLRCS